PCWVALLVIVLFIVSCSNLAPPPEVSPALVANARPDHANANVLATGRKLFVSCCLECHTLPSVAGHPRDEWPHLVDRMSRRANLSPTETGRHRLLSPPRSLAKTPPSQTRGLCVWLPSRGS